MKTSKKILLTALSATLATTLTSGIALTALADEATKDHEFSSKYDAVFEDFDRADITNTVTADNGVNLGEKPYLHVKYTAGTSASPANAIYKQGSGNLAKVKDGGKITLTMRAPEGDVELSEILFGLRGGQDSDDIVYAKPLSELKDSDGEDLPALTTEWQTYEISFATSYEEDETYVGISSTIVGANSADLMAIHVYAATATDEGTLDIASVKYETTGSNYLNDFLGGVTVQDTAKNADTGTWWAGSSTGYIVKRTVNMTSGSFTVVKDSVVGNYSYAVIEAAGDVERLKVATTTDGTAWGTPAAYDGYSVNLNGDEKGFKFSYDGTDENGVTIKRIYLTNVEIPAPAIAVPVIDASSVEILEDFAVAQKGINDKWEEMSTAPELAVAGLEYRLSYSNGDKVEVKDGNLVFDATELGAGHINYKFKSKTPVKGDYIVLKVKGEGGANLDAFRFALGNPEDVLSEVVWTNQMKAGVDLSVALLNDSNPYKTADGWYYVVIDIEESGFKLFSEGYSIMDISYSGTGKLYINNVFFCNNIDVVVPNVEKDLSYPDAQVDYDKTESYEYRYMYVLNEGYGTTLEFDITPKDDNFDISNWRIGLQAADNSMLGTFWGGENADGSLITTDGKKLNELTYTKGVATHVVVDLAASGIEGAFIHVHSHADNIDGFTVTNVKLHTSTPVYAAKDIDKTIKDLDNAFVIQNEAGDADYALNFVPTEAGYQYAGYVKVDGLNKSYDLLALEIEIAEGTDISGIRFEFADGAYFASENAKMLYLEDGTLLGSTQFTAEEAKTVYIDLAKSGITMGSFHIHTNGTDTGAFKINSAKLVSYAAKDFITPAVNEHYAPKYTEQMGKLSLVKDNVKPEVSITTATTAKVGNEITVTYTASDNVTAAADLTVTVSVTKDGNAVTLTNNKFTAEEGVYTVKVTVRDENGNEAEDTIQITVTKESTGNGDDKPAVTPPAETGCAGGCGSTSVGDGFMGGGMALMGIAVLFTVNKIVRKKKEN